MGLKKLVERLQGYGESAGGAGKALPGLSDVEKVLKKLRRKEAELAAELDEEDREDKRLKIARKLEVARLHVVKAEALLSELTAAEARPPAK